MDLREYSVGSDTEARYASVEELREGVGKTEKTDIRKRLSIAATLRELMEARDGDIVDGLIGRLDADFLDDVTIVLEMSTQQTVEEELKLGTLYQSGEDVM